MLFTLITFLITVSGRIAMSYEVVTIPTLKIIGIEHKTTNNNNQSVTDMPQFWDNYFTKNIEISIPHKQEPLNRVCVYTDYNPEGYTVIIGACVTSLETVPVHLVGREFPSSKYAVFTINGPLETNVLKTWQHIWSIADLPRAYTHDFELYEYIGDNLQFAKVFVSIV